MYSKGSGERGGEKVAGRDRTFCPRRRHRRQSREHRSFSPRVQTASFRAFVLFSRHWPGTTTSELRWRRCGSRAARELRCKQLLILFGCLLFVKRKTTGRGKKKKKARSLSTRLDSPSLQRLSLFSSLSSTFHFRNGNQKNDNTTKTAPSLPPLRRDRVDRGPGQRAPHQGGCDLEGVQGPPRGPRADPEGD